MIGVCEGRTGYSCVLSDMIQKKLLLLLYTFLRNVSEKFDKQKRWSPYLNIGTHSLCFCFAIISGT
jgi:hypothetical protein